MTKTLFMCVFGFIILCALTGCQGVGFGSGPTPTPTPVGGGTLQSVNHIIFMMQENRSFDAYFGKLNDYRASLGLGRDTDGLSRMATLTAST
jgi:hypothetical protein